MFCLLFVCSNNVRLHGVFLFREDPFYVVVLWLLQTIHCSLTIINWELRFFILEFAGTVDISGGLILLISSSYLD